MAKGTTEEGKAHGAELASGYIALTVKYGSAMSQIGKDVRGLEDQAKVSGARAGESVRKGLADGASHGAKQGRIAAMREWSNAEVEAKTTAEKIGKAIGFAIAQPIALPFRAIRAGLHGIGSTGKKEFEELGESGKASMASVIPMGGLMATAIGGIAPEAVVAGAGIGILVGGFGALLAVGEKWEGISHRLSFGTGLKGEELEQMTSMIAGIGKEIPSSFDNIADSVAAVTRNLHLSGDALKTVSEQVTVLKDHGQDIDVQGLGLATRAMGTKAEEVPALLDQLYTANTRTGISMNTLIETLARGGSTFKQFGLNAGQSATLLTQFDAAGVDASKVVPTLNRVFKDTAKAGEAPAQFLKEQTDQLKKFIDAGDQIDADKLAIKLFGVKNATPIMAAIQNGKLDLNVISSGMDDGGDKQSVLKNAKESEGIGDKFTMMKNGIETLLKPYGETLMKNIGGYFEKAASFLTKYGPDIMKKIASNFISVRHALDNVGHALGNFWHACENTWHALENTWHAVTNFWHACENVWHAVTNVWHAFENIGHAIGNVLHAFENIGHAIGATIVFFGQLPEKVGSFFAGLPDKIGAFFSTAADKVAQFFSSAVDKIVGFFRSLPDKIGNIISSAFSGFHIPGFAAGGFLPGSATIQKPQGAGGLVQWAEKSTGGEAFIPLSPGKRQRSVEIWKKTGQMLGMNSYDWGGIHLDSSPDDTTPMDPDDPHVPDWIRAWCKGTGEFAGLPPFTGKWSYDGGGKVITRGMPGQLHGANGVHNNLDPRSGINLNGKAKDAWGDILGSGSPGNAGAQFGMWSGGPDALAAANGGLFSFDDGGFNGPDVEVAMGMAGTKYSQGSRNDCSGMVGRVIEGTLHTGGPLPTTKNMGQWLSKLGFRTGMGADGAIRVGWYNHGNSPNDGHAAMTLSDGENAEAGGKNGVFTMGAGAAGADNPEFDHHMYLPISAMYGEGEGGEGGSGGSGGAFGGSSGGVGGSGSSGGVSGGMPPGATAGVGPNGERGYFTGGGDPDKIQADKDRITSLQDELKSLENKRDHSKKELTDDEKTKLDDEIEKKNHELDRAEKKLQQTEQGDFHKDKEGSGGKGEKGEGGSDKDNPLSSLGDILGHGITETFLPPGFINPLDTPLAKSGGALLSYFGNLLSGKGLGSSAKGLGGVHGFSPSALTPHAASPNAESTPDINGGEPGLLPKPGQLPGVKNLANLAGFSAPADGANGGGGVTNNNFGPNYSGATIGHDPQQHQQAVRNDANAAKRINVTSTQRMGFV